MLYATCNWNECKIIWLTFAIIIFIFIIIIIIIAVVVVDVSIIVIFIVLSILSVYFDRTHYHARHWYVHVDRAAPTLLLFWQSASAHKWENAGNSPLYEFAYFKSKLCQICSIFGLSIHFATAYSSNNSIYNSLSNYALLFFASSSSLSVPLAVAT